jgi:hypothetical protein
VYLSQLPQSLPQIRLITTRRLLSEKGRKTGVTP